MKLNVLVVGAGMYVCGRGTSGYGTVMPALIQAYKDGLVGDVFVAASKFSSISLLKKKIKSLNAKMRSDLEIKCFPEKGNDRKAYIKAAAMIPKPACAIISTPDHLHTDMAYRLMSAGFHVLAVKPLAPTVADVKKLLALQREKKVYGAVEFHKRFDAANLKMREVIRNGKLGEILYFHVEFSQRRQIPLKVFKTWVKNTNIFQYLGVHYVDMIHFVTGAKPVRLVALGQKKFLKSKGINAYDAIQVVIEWTNKGKTFISTILTNWVDPDLTSAMSDQKIKVIGTKGRYESDQKDRGIQMVTQDVGIQDINPYFSEFYTSIDDKSMVFKGYGERSIRQFLKDAREIISEKCKPESMEGLRPTFKDALVSTAVVEAVNRSLINNGRWVEVNGC